MKQEYDFSKGEHKFYLPNARLTLPIYSDDVPTGISMSLGIRITIVYLDDLVMELQVFGSNGRFSGEAETYGGHEKLKELARTIAGFPTRPQDERKFEFGTFDPEYAGGGVRLRFYCTDSWGHAGVDVEFRADPHATRHAESSSFFIPIEAAAVDEFVGWLRGMEVIWGANVWLRGAR